MDQTNVQRVLGARTLKDGQRGAIFAGFLKLLFLSSWFFRSDCAGSLSGISRYDYAYP